MYIIKYYNNIQLSKYFSIIDSIYRFLKKGKQVAGLKDNVIYSTVIYDKLNTLFTLLYKKYRKEK